MSKEVRALIFRITAENPTWGAPRIHGELLKLGFHLSETTVSRWLRRIPRIPDPPVKFLRNHRQLQPMDFFTVPTLTYGILYCFFVIGHDRRQILRFNATRNPNALWIVQQMREAWPYVPTHRFLLFDRDSKFGTDVISAVRDLGSQPTRTAFRSPWQNGVGERWVGSCRRDLLDHVIVLNEQHLKWLMSEYIRYYHEDRRTSDSRRIRQQAGQQRYVPRWEARFTSSLDSADRTIVTPSRLSLRQLCLSGRDQLLLSQSGPRVTLSLRAEPMAWSNIGPE